MEQEVGGLHGAFGLSGDMTWCVYGHSGKIQAWVLLALSGLANGSRAVHAYLAQYLRLSRRGRVCAEAVPQDSEPSVVHQTSCSPRLLLPAQGNLRVTSHGFS